MTQPVGQALAEILTECGIVVDKGCACNHWINEMNTWGPDGCRRKKTRIMERLREMSYKKASLWDWVKVASHGYATTGMLVDAAIRRAEK